MTRAPRWLSPGPPSAIGLTTHYPREAPAVAGDNVLIVAGDRGAEPRFTSGSLEVADVTTAGAPRGGALGSPSWDAERDHPRARAVVMAARPPDPTLGSDIGGQHD